MYYISKQRRFLVEIIGEETKNFWENGYFKRMKLHQLAFTLFGFGILISIQFSTDQLGNKPSFAFSIYKLR